MRLGIQMVRKLAVVVLLAVLGFSVYQVGWQVLDYWRGADSYSVLQAAVEPMPEGVRGSAMDFDALRAINSDVVGWVRCAGTKLDYPIVQAADNAQYLAELFDGSAGRQGCPFLDCDNAADFSDANSVVYGHHMRDGSMFKPLSGYKEQDFYKEHPTLELYTPTGDYTVRVFAGGVFHDTDNAWRQGFVDEAEWQEWLSAIKCASYIETDVAPAYGARLLTLSTCSYEFAGARFVLFGVLEPIL